MNGSDYFGFVLMLPYGAFILWFFNLFLRSNESVSSLVTDWPTTRPKEFFAWMGVSTMILGLLCLLLFTNNKQSTLAKHHLITPGTFIEYHGDHASFSYAFIVQGYRYHGYGTSDQGEIDKIKEGMPFNVYYDPTYPNINSVSEPTRSLHQRSAMLTFFSFLVTGLLAVLIRKLGTLMRADFMTPASDPRS